MTSSLAVEVLAEAESLEALALDSEQEPIVTADRLRRTARMLRTAADVLTVNERPDALAYLDNAIRQWRADTNPDHGPAMRSHYIDAFQSVRVSLFGDLLPD